MENLYLEFTRSYLGKMGIAAHIADRSRPLPPDVDLGLRKMICESPSMDRGELVERQDDPEGLPVISLTEDIYGCHYIVLPVPGQEFPADFVAGPYLTESPGVLKSGELCKKLGIPQGLHSFVHQYFSSLPCLSGLSSLECYMEALGDSLFGPGNYRIEYTRPSGSRDMPKFTPKDSSEPSEGTMALLEHRYQLEEKIMEAIARGDADKAVRIVSDMAFSGIDNRASSTLRSRKNLLFAFNTVCRKAAERAKVHPVHLDEMSRRMAIRIENMTSNNEYWDLRKELLINYCGMVRRNATKGYSPIMRKALSHVSRNLDSPDLTLRGTADALSLNKNYLATLFKRETGETFTGYVNKKRIEHAVFLLDTTDAGIQTIASACGIPDTTYFTRLFRREKGMSPSRYRKMHLMVPGTL